MEIVNSLKQQLSNFLAFILQLGDRLTVSDVDVTDKIVIWDKDGTVTDSANPDERESKILPGVKKAMKAAKFNFIISGIRCTESEQKNFDPDIVIQNLIKLMEELPISAAAFSPSIGGTTCYVVIRENDNISVFKAHEDHKYSEYVGKFKKPDIGMFKVIEDVALQYFRIEIDKANMVMIGDMWQDEAAANEFGIRFLEANLIHEEI